MCARARGGVACVYARACARRFRHAGVVVRQVGPHMHSCPAQPVTHAAQVQGVELAQQTAKERAQRACITCATICGDWCDTDEHVDVAMTVAPKAARWQTTSTIGSVCTSKRSPRRPLPFGEIFNFLVSSTCSLCFSTWSQITGERKFGSLRATRKRRESGASAPQASTCCSMHQHTSVSVLVCLPGWRCRVQRTTK